MALWTGYEDPGSALALNATSTSAPAAAFVHAGTGPDAPRSLHSEFASALRAALPADPVFGPQSTPPAQHALQRPLTAAPSSGETGFSTAAVRMATAFVCLRLVSCGCRFCGGSTPLGGHFGRDKTLALRACRL